MQKVTAGAKGTNSKGAEGATRDVPPSAECGSLLCGTVNEQTAAAIVAVASSMVAAAQLSLVLGVAEGNMELVESVGKLAALSILAEAGGGVAGAELSLVASGADPGYEGRGGGVRQREQGLGEGKFTI